MNYLNRCQWRHLQRLVGADLARNPAVVAAWIDCRAIADHETRHAGGVTWQPYASRADGWLLLSFVKFCLLTGLDFEIMPYAGTWAPNTHRITVHRRAKSVI